MKKQLKKAYDILGDLTPLKTDCGKMCSSACCKGDGGMYLFPGEYELLKDVNGFRFEKKILDGYGEVYFMTCNDTCDRTIRPLSCRIFPLVAKFIDGKLFVRLDARGRSVCPLTQKSILSLDKEFLEAVKKVLIMLCEDDRVSQYLNAVSKMEEKYRNVIPGI